MWLNLTTIKIPLSVIQKKKKIYHIPSVYLDQNA